MSIKPIICVLLAVISMPVTAATYEVQPGDNIWNIANQFTQNGVTTHQMIAAIHELNSSQLGGNLDNIYPGMELEIPSLEMAAVSDTSKATNLLARDNGASTHKSAQVEDILLKINNIEKEISQVISEIEATKMTFQNTMNY